MGAGIALALADAGLTVTALESDEAAASTGQERVKGLYERQVKSGRLSPETMAERLSRLTVGSDWSACPSMYAAATPNGWDGSLSLRMA